MLCVALYAAGLGVLYAALCVGSELDDMNSLFNSDFRGFDGDGPNE